MTALILFWSLLFIGIAVFSAVNWSVLTAPTTLSLVVTSVEAPLGLIMLGLLALLSVVFLVFAVSLRTSVLIESRRHARELQAQRELAEKAEASRYTELRTVLENRLQQMADQSTQGQAEMLTRLEQLERSVRSSVEQAGNSLAAYIGELEDRMEGRGDGYKPERPV